MTWLALVIGVLLRMTDMTLPDMATDEAQFALGASAAQPPLGMALQQLAQTLLGHTLLGARMTSVLLGIATLPLLYLLARQWVPRREAMTAAAVAALMPGHVLYSRLAYMDATLVFAWVCTALATHLAARHRDGPRLLLLAAAVMATTFVKTQGLLLPCLLLLGRVANERGRVWRDPIAVVLALSMLPIAAYVATHPGIAATLLQNTGTLYGLPQPLQRVARLLLDYWLVLGPFAIGILLSLPHLRRYGWPAIALCITALLQHLLLGPGHMYYTTAAVAFALPLGSAIVELPRRWSHATLAAATCITLLLLAPARLSSPFLAAPFNAAPYWNANSPAINAALADRDRVIVLGDAGHHVRWYIAPQVLVGKDMPAESLTGAVLTLHGTPTVSGALLYTDEYTRIVLR